jgi:hypothetical protein
MQQQAAYDGHRKKKRISRNKPKMELVAFLFISFALLFR